jgi:hypothetical protein
MTKEERHELCVGMYLSLIVAAFTILFTSGCESPADAVEVVIPTPAAVAPSCPCGDACECVELKAKLAEAERENEVNKLVAVRLQKQADDLADEVGLVYRPGDKVEHPNGTYILEWKWHPKPVQQSVLKPKRVQAPDPYMSPCGPGGCPTPSAGGFGIFGRRR